MSVATASLKGKRCLIIEHDERFAALEERCLAEAGMRTSSVGTSASALQQLATLPWDAVVLDLQLPDGNALAVVRRALERKQLGPAVLVTSGSGDCLAGLYEHELAVPIVPKSRLPRALVAFLAAALSESARTDASSPYEGDEETRISARDATSALSAREAAVFGRLARGQAPKQIAHELGVSHATVRSHARNAYQKMGVTNLREALATLRPH